MTMLLILMSLTTFILMVLLKFAVFHYLNERTVIQIRLNWDKLRELQQWNQQWNQCVVSYVMSHIHKLAYCLM